MEHNHSHNHPHSHSSDGNIGLAFFLNLSFTVIELIGGLLTNSIAIMSDAVHDFGDSLSLALAWYFQKKSKKGSTEKYTYGYKRFSLLGAIITSAVLIIGSIYILTEAIPRLLSPQETNAGGMFVLAVLGIAVNGAAVLRTRKGSSINERVVSLHLLEDVLGWAAVLIGSAVMYFTGFTVIDPILSILIAFYVIFNVIKNIKQVMPILLQGTPPNLERGYIKQRLLSIGQIENIHDLHIWSLDENSNILTVHAMLQAYLPQEELVKLKEKVRAVLRDDGIGHVTIEFEFSGEICGLNECTG